jgi:hypothetical protein
MTLAALDCAYCGEPDISEGNEHVVGRHFLGVVPCRHHGIELPDGTLSFSQRLYVTIL